MKSDSMLQKFSEDLLMTSNNSAVDSGALTQAKQTTHSQQACLEWAQY